MIPDSNHNASLPLDVVTDAFFNYQWRKIVVGILERELFALAETITDEGEKQQFESRVYGLIHDIYSTDGGTPVMATVAVKVRRTTNQSILTATGENYASFDTEDFDTDGFWDVSEPTKIIIPNGFDGLYLVQGSGLNSNVAGNRTMSLWKNASREARLEEVAETRTQGVISVLLPLVAGDEIRLSFTSSTNSSLVASANDSAWLSLLKVGEI